MLDAVEVALREDAVALDGDRRVADADGVHLPDDFRPAVGPLLEQAGLGAASVAVRPAPLRPVGGDGGECEAAGDEKAEGRVCVHGAVGAKISPGRRNFDSGST